MVNFQYARKKASNKTLCEFSLADICYLNVDLDLESSNSLAPIVKALGEEVFVLHQGGSRGLFTASLELAVLACPADAESSINRFCTLIENLPKKAKRLWNTCCTRIFDIGYQSGDSPRSFRSLIHSDTVMRVATLGGSIMITIYPRPKRNQSPK